MNTSPCRKLGVRATNFGLLVGLALSIASFGVLLASIQESSEKGMTIEAKAKVCKQGSD